jgi:hypothetical protein
VHYYLASRDNGDEGMNARGRGRMILTVGKAEKNYKVSFYFTVLFQLHRSQMR